MRDQQDNNATKALEEFPDLWLRCFSHNLNLAISKALKIQRVDTEVKAWSKASHRAGREEKN